jgi:hypothetical protein
MATNSQAAALYQIELGLDGDPRASMKTCVILRKLFKGKILLWPGSRPQPMG